MSILKSIMHHWNSISESYDTLHPETEYAQVTDFGNGILAHLLDSTLVSAVTAVSTGSLFGKLVEKLLEDSGVQYNFQNSSAWYICLGDLFGGLIIQGGNVSTIPVNENYTVTYPITFHNVGIPVATAMSLSLDVSVRIQATNLTSVTVHPFRDSGAGTPSVRYIAIGV